MVALATVGIVDGAVGVAWPSMRETFDQPLAALGIVMAAYTGGYFVTSIAGGWLFERIGTGDALVGMALAALAGASLFAVSPTWGIVLAGGALLGMAGGAAVPLGLSLAAVFPVLVAVTPERLGVHRAARALGLQIAASSIGGIAMSAALGIGAQAWGADALGWMFVLSAAALAALHVVALGRRPRMQP